MNQWASRFRNGLCATAVTVVVAWASDGQPARTLDEFFDNSILHRIDVRMVAADWQTLHDKFLENTYYRCEVEWNGIVVSNAGIRSRGTGSRNPIKPALGIDFTRYVSAQRFLGLKSIVLRNLSQDPTGAHEMVAEKMFARLGLPYSREAHARLYVNGGYAGVYLVVEPLDERFLDTRLGESAGYLYEIQRSGDPYHFEDLGTDPNLYVPNYFNPKTHSSDPDGQWIADMIHTINAAPDEEFAPAVGAYMNLEAFVTHLAAEQFMADWDGILSDLGMSNAYFYRRGGDVPAIFLVWDKDGAMTAEDFPVWSNTQPNVLARRALAVPELRQRYMETLNAAAEVAGGPGGWMEGEFTRIVGLIREAMREDPYKVCMRSDGFAPCSEEEVDAQIDFSYNFLRDRSTFVRGELQAAGFVALAGPALGPLAAGNAATGEPVLSPGSLALLRLPESAGNAQADYPYPVEFQGFQVLVDKRRAPLMRVAGQDVLFQVPAEVSTGPAPVQLYSNGSSSNTLTVEVRPNRGGVFVATHADGRTITNESPAVGGAVIVLYATGLGAPEKSMASDEAAPLDVLLPLKKSVAAVAGESAATVLWAGMAPGFVGLQQVVLRLPDALPRGMLKLTLVADGEPAYPFTIPVR